MAPQTVTRVSECFIKPSHPDPHPHPHTDPLPLPLPLPPDAHQPIHLTPFELPFLTANYSQKGLLFLKPPSHQNNNFSITRFLNDLQHSLSVTLNHFHPLAGRLATQKEINPQSYIIYLDPLKTLGVKFVYAATTNVTVSDVLTPIDVPPVVHSFFDLNNAVNHDGHVLPLLSIQVTELVDGIFIGGSINHVVADGTSFWGFMATWSKIHRTINEEMSGCILSTSRAFNRTPIAGCDPIINLPYTHQDEFIERLQSPIIKERFFHFSPSCVSRLKAKANTECNTDNISSLQSLSALLWRCITRARAGRSADTVTACKLAISNRHRLSPPLPEDYFGNPVQLVKGTAAVGELMDHGLGWAALRLHEAVRSHDGAAVKEWVRTWCKAPSIMKMSGVFDPNAVSIGSSPRFDMYGCEFGLGKAVATRSGCANKADGKITMFPGPEGCGSMVAEVCLLPENMVRMERDEEFLRAQNGEVEGQASNF